jgi:hypothetical protein
MGDGNYVEGKRNTHARVGVSLVSSYQVVGSFPEKNLGLFNEFGRGESNPGLLHTCITVLINDKQMCTVHDGRILWVLEIASL